MKIWEITDEIERFAPLSLQESYDNCGYMCGSRENEINGILLAIDITEAVVDEAISLGCNLIISHHPLIFRGIKSLSTDNYINRTLIKAIRNNITIYAAHTNMDSTQNGVSKVMADKPDKHPSIGNSTTRRRLWFRNNRRVSYRNQNCEFFAIC